MSEKISYTVGVDVSEFTGGMKEAVAEVKALSAASSKSNVGGFGGMLETTAGKARTLGTSIREVVQQVRELNTTSQENGLGPLSGDLQEATGSASSFSAELVNLQSDSDGLGARMLLLGGYAAGFTVAIGAAVAAVKASQAILAQSGTDEARVSLEAYDKQVTNLGQKFSSTKDQFIEMVAELVEPITLTINSEAITTLRGLNRDFEKLRNITGFGDKEKAAEQKFVDRSAAGGSDKYKQQQAQKEADAQAIRDHNDAVQANNRRQEEAVESEKRNAKEIEKITEERIKQEEAIKKANAERYFAATLSREQNLARQLEEIKKSGPSTPEEVTGSGTAADAARIARRAEIERTMDDLKAAAAAKAANAAEAEAEAAERKAESEARTLKSREQAATLSSLEEKALQAHASGNEKLEQSLLRQLRVEEVKQSMMSQQGLSEPVAARAAERRVALEEAAARRDENPGRIRLRNAEESKAAREDRMSATDKARKARWDATDAAKSAAAKFVGPPAPAKDKNESMAKKLDKIDTISTQLENLGLAK